MQIQNTTSHTTMAFRRCTSSLSRIARIAHCGMSPFNHQSSTCIGQPSSSFTTPRFSLLRYYSTARQTSIINHTISVTSPPSTRQTSSTITAATSVEAPTESAETSPIDEQEDDNGAHLTLADLPTSDESEEMLRIRHSVRSRRCSVMVHRH